MASITIEASKVARKSPIRVDSSLVGDSFWSGRRERFPTIVESSFECRKVGLQVLTPLPLRTDKTVRVTSNFLNRFIAIAPLLLYLVGAVTSHLWQSYLL